MADFSDAPVVNQSAWTVDRATAREAALTVAEQAPGEMPMLLAMLGLTGDSGPEDGKWASYAFGRPQKTDLADQGQED